MTTIQDIKRQLERLADEVTELIIHLKGECAGKHHWCSYCYEEHEIKRAGIEEINLYEDHLRRECEDLRD